MTEPVAAPAGGGPDIRFGSATGRRIIAAAVLGSGRSTYPMVPLTVFQSRQFSGANVVTLFVSAALGATTFLLVVHGGPGGHRDAGGPSSEQP